MFGEYTVDLISEEPLTGFTVRKISVLEKKVCFLYLNHSIIKTMHALLLTLSDQIIYYTHLYVHTLNTLYAQFFLIQTQKAHQVTQFHITCWTPNGQCSNLKAVVDVIEEVAKVQRRTGSKPILVHCRYEACVCIYIVTCSVSLTLVTQ